MGMALKLYIVWVFYRRGVAGAVKLLCSPTTLAATGILAALAESLRSDSSSAMYSAVMSPAFP